VLDHLDLPVCHPDGHYSRGVHRCIVLLKPPFFIFYFRIFVNLPKASKMWHINGADEALGFEEGQPICFVLIAVALTGMGWPFGSHCLDCCLVSVFGKTLQICPW
jgi:hypothetical protein